MSFLSLEFIHYKSVVYNVRFLYFSKAAQVILYCFLAFHSELLTSLSLCCMLNVFLSCCCFILKAVFFKKKRIYRKSSWFDLIDFHTAIMITGA